MAEIPRRAVIPEIPGQLGMSMTTGTVNLGMLMLEMFGMLGTSGMSEMCVMSGMLGMSGIFGMSGMLGMCGMPGMVIERRMYTRKKPAVMVETT